MTTDASDKDDPARLFSPSFERNFEPIRDALARILGPGDQGSRRKLLEIGAGTGQHAAHLALSMPGWDWQPSDPDPQNRRSIAAWAEYLSPDNLQPPLDLDARADWGTALPKLHAVFSANVIHISPWPVTEGIVIGAGKALSADGTLIFYGPFREKGDHTGEGNARFDVSLRAQNPDWGIRDLDDVEALAHGEGFGPAMVHLMPANNRLVVFQRRTDPA
ncbi:MAG: DUF938 domain-containing protein [Pseudomonadota bacterium]